MFDSFKNGLNMKIPQGEYSQEIKDKISNSLMGRKGAWEGKTRTEHSQWLKENGSGLSYKRTLKHKENLSKGIKKLWEYKGDEISKKISKAKKGKGLKPIKCHTLDMEFSSLLEASKQLDISIGSLCNHLKGKTTHIKGFYFTYI